KRGASYTESWLNSGTLPTAK
ncbi:EAL domain protein, partial [Vibrio parahaemolyticus V-223/04]